MNNTQQSSNIFKFGNKVVELCCYLGRQCSLSPPVIKLVGSQSSGKSTTITNIIGYKILPVGENMVTRNPIYIRLHQIEQGETNIKLSYMNGSNLEEYYFIKFNENDENANKKQSDFRNKVTELVDIVTEAQTKGKYNISKTPIFIDVESTTVMNLSFTDLPGLIATAYIDKGQPRDLKIQIEELIKSELMQENVIALVMAKAGNDLAIDLGISIINDVKTQLIQNSKFTSITSIGVLTKPDQLDGKSLSDINSIISGKMPGNSGEELSKSEMMTEGYLSIYNYAKNKQDEEKFFMEKFNQSDDIIKNKRYGIENLKQVLQNLLLNSIVNQMPFFEQTLRDLLKSEQTKYQQLGEEMQSDQDKMRYSISIISELSRLIYESINSSGYRTSGVGGKIKMAEKEFCIKVTNLKPFSSGQNGIPDSYFENIINNFDDFGMGSNANISKILDQCIKDPVRDPVMLIKPISDELSRTVSEILSLEINKILNTSPSVSSLQSYPAFKELLFVTITNKIKSYEIVANKFVNELLQKKKKFLWSTSENFVKWFNMQHMPKIIEEEKKPEKSAGFISGSAIKSTASYVSYKATEEKSLQFQNIYEASQIRKGAEEYYSTIIEGTRDLIVQTIAGDIVCELSMKITEILNSLVNSSEGDQPIAIKCIVEQDNVAKKRKEHRDNIKNIESAIKLAMKYKM